jgi:hypothetical protein
VPAISEWLADEINRTAGRKTDDPPLTLGDLKAKGINLVVLTTNLVHGRPYTIPFGSREFAFDPDELARSFPKHVVDWLVKKTKPHGTLHLREALERQGLVSLPANDDLPVVMAARMSLSFPLLISAVPLWSFDFTMPATKGAGAKAERCWFSDGGISSNFPVHFFDGPIPRWPTFAFNLKPFHPAHPEVAVWRPAGNGGGQSEAWNRFDAHGTVPGFLGAIFDTMHDWHDNALLRVPGYRDRIVHVSLHDSEGGMNLNMPTKVIADLEERGRMAGRLLAEAFTAPNVPGEPPCAWDNHRWVRLRTTMNLLEELQGKFATAYGYQDPGSTDYDALLNTLGLAAPYPWGEGQQTAAIAAVRGFLTLWTRPPAPCLGQNVPRPVPYLTVTPPTAMPPRP